MKLDWVTDVVADENHNAFTGLAFLKGRYFLAFRSGKGHVDDQAEQVIMVSDRGTQWNILRRRLFPPLAKDGTVDYRDSHFLTEPHRLALYSFSTFVRRGSRQRGPSYTCLQYTENGDKWSEPFIVQQDVVFWKPIKTPLGYFAAGYRELPQADEYCVELYQSTDGVGWEKQSLIAGNGSETALHLVAPDELLAVVRTEKPPYHLEFYRSRKPFVNWTGTTVIPRIIQAPHLVEWHGNLYLLGRERPDYRRTADPQAPSFSKHRTKMWQLQEDTPQEALEFPSCGDTSYVGAVVNPDGSLLVSYYSQHEHGMNVCPAVVMPTDIFVARVVF